MNPEAVKVPAHKNVITKLETGGGWHILSQGNALSMTKIFNGREITVNLIRNEDGFYTLSHPGYDYVSHNSHFVSTINVDKRLCLNKTLLTSLVTTLRKAEVWPFIKNKDFLKLNESNKSLASKNKKSKLAKELEELLSY